ncbi:MAG TPA: FKBP-type peptidyl-prolyl cis-trans isomerase [Rhabdochlamydiaceae bacterium]|nr:FKBP-type peptidyl-prolyl cis-trans isomerase [Rhabdochlamydiaceae bacterium]
MKSTKEKVSYCIGLETGRSLQKQFSDMDSDLLKRGFEDGLANALPKLSQEEVQSIMQALRQQIDQQQRAYIAKMSDNNRKEGEDFLEKNKNEDGVVTLKSGLQYKVLQTGTGAKPSITDVVSVHYRGSFINGQIFDSSYERGKPQVFPVNRVIPGWSEALQLMQVGDKWQIVVPHYLAYGEVGFGNEIPPSTTLIFEMELLDINHA